MWLSVFSLHSLQRELDGDGTKKLIAITLPLLLVFTMMAAPSVSAQVSTYTLAPGDTATHDGEDYTITELVGGQSCKIYFDGAESSILVEGDTIGSLTIIEIGTTHVVLEGEQAPVEDDEDEPAPVAELRYTLESGDVLLFSDANGVNGAMAYVFGETMNPTFLFWSGGRLPTISRTPTPDEKVSLGVGQSRGSQTIWGLTVKVESVEGDDVVVIIETDDSISLMKTTVGGSDVSDIVEQLKLWMQSQMQVVPTATTTPAAPIDLTGLTVVVGLGVSGFLFSLFMKWRTSWGYRW